MKSFFSYKFIYSLFKNRSNKDGFTLAELIISGFVSLLILISGYTLMRMNIQVNKSDELNLKLGGKINNALDFIIDEINSSKRVITTYNEVPNSCRPLPEGELVLALRMPDQAKSSASYQTSNIGIGSKTKKQNWVALAKDCPIFYNLVRDYTFRGKSTSYILKRTGPTVDDKGFYNPTDIKTTLVTDRIRSDFNDDIRCLTTNNQKWTRKQIKGIILCTDEKGKGAEIMINAEASSLINPLTIAKTTGGYARIQDDDLMNLGNAGDGNSGIINSCTNCDFFQKPLKRKVTFFIDISGSMNWGRIKGQTPMESAKNELINSIRALPVNQGFKLQVVAFNHWSRQMWSVPMEVTTSSKLYAISWVSRLRAGGGTNPWQGISEAIQNSEVEQIAVLSDGWTKTSGRCFNNGRYYSYSQCFKDYNDNVRATKDEGTVQIDSFSMRNDFCSSGWMGQLSSKNSGSCTHIN